MCSIRCNENANRVHQSGFSQYEGNALLLAALLQPDRLTERLMETINDTGISARERDQLLHALQEELTSFAMTKRPRSARRSSAVTTRCTGQDRHRGPS